MTKEEVYASHFFGISLEIRLLLGAVLLGLLLGAVYDVFRALRLSFKHHSATVFAEDVLFSLIFWISFYSYSTELCRGEIRFFVLAGTAIGFALYLLTLGRIVVLFAAKAVGLIKNLLLQLGKVFKKLICFLCGAPFFYSEGEKNEKNPCAESDV